MSHLPTLVLLRGLVSGTDKFKLQSLSLNTGSHFFIAYHELILNNAKAFVIFNPLT